MAPGLSAMIGGRPKATPCLRLHSFLYPKDKVPSTVTVGGQSISYTCTNFPQLPQKLTEVETAASRTTAATHQGTETFILEDLAYARSGDKGIIIFQFKM